MVVPMMVCGSCSATADRGARATFAGGRQACSARNGPVDVAQGPLALLRRPSSGQTFNRVVPDSRRLVIHVIGSPVDGQGAGREHLRIADGRRQGTAHRRLAQQPLPVTDPAHPEHHLTGRG